MVSVKSSCTVTPSNPTPESCLWLSGSDQIYPWTHVRSIHVYGPHQHQSHGGAIHTLTRSLADILVPYYPLAGRLRSIGGGRVEVVCNAKGALLQVAESTKTIHDYGDFRPDQPIQELLPKVDYSKPLEEIPLLLVQVTLFSGGGLCIGLALSHSMADGYAAMQFIISWAKLARGLPLEQSDLPFLDRTVLKCCEPVMPPRFPHPEFKPLPLILGASDTDEERKKETTVQLLKLTAEEVSKIKDRANEGAEISRPFSRFEAVSAHIWRCVTKARRNEYQQPTTVWLVGDIRNRVSPPLPPNYFGNAVLPTVTRDGISGEVISKPLSHAAQKIREAIGFLREERYVRSQLDRIEGTEQVDSLRVAYNQGGVMKQPFLGNPNMRIVSWMTLPMHEADFGWGKAVHVGPASLNADGKVTMIHSPSDDGSILVAIRLQNAHISDFKHFLYHDL
ncbi:spermidine hydroxycinnamoyl transferase [Neltuma alba]|uniref:spermidine hydroxycinnamoyl transferase n=1 Tax=Neltuma alba TaxID=207710 RepID=UPI0010A3A166|nr:spermidine hydroxycinnamoyl transferase-like [Prosopis alba]